MQIQSEATPMPAFFRHHSQDGTVQVVMRPLSNAYMRPKSSPAAAITENTFSDEAKLI